MTQFCGIDPGKSGAIAFIDTAGDWSARDGTLVFTGDVGHGRHLQDVFDFIHRLAAQAHRLGGRIVWTLGNHDLYVDREGGQGGEDSLGYRLWPTIREAALHPERHPGLTVQAAYFEHGKLFVHGGVLPNIVELAIRERGAGDAEAVASYVNAVFREALVKRERITAQDLPHEIFQIGTSHARERRMPGEIGYEPAGVFTPDLRELDHYRYHAELLPQIVGHTASRRAATWDLVTQTVTWSCVQGPGTVVSVYGEDRGIPPAISQRIYYVPAD